MIGQTISHYRLLEKLGEGGMGLVYLAEDINLGRRVAIKFLASAAPDDHQHRARFLREARAVSNLSHPNIATIYDYGETAEGQPYIVMEWVRGENLSDLLEKSALSIPRALEIIEEVAEALREAHAHGIVHRDVKPSNVLINERGQVKVLDFGLAKLLNEESDHPLTDPAARALLAARTQSGVMVGTPLYLSPEQATGAPVDARSDLFALGALLYECIAGQPAFGGATVIEIAAQVIHVNPLPPSSVNPRVSKELDRITLKALAKKPEERYQSAVEFLRDLRSLQAADEHSDLRVTRLTSPNALRQSALTTISETLRKPRLSIGFVLLAFLITVGAAWFLVRLFKPALHKPTPDAQKLYDAGTNALREGAYHQATQALQKSIEADELYALAHARLAEAWTELDFPDAAKTEMLRARELIPESSALQQLDALYVAAIQALVMGDTARAVKSYTEIARLSPQKAEAYVDLGRAYEKNYEFDKALQNYIEATNHDPQYATAFLRIGIVYAQKSDVPSALAAFEKADSIYQARDNREGRAEVFYQRGALYNKREKIAEARQELEQALNFARVAGNSSQQVKTLLQMSSASIVAGDKGKAIEYAQQALDVAQMNGMDDLTSRAMADLGTSYFLSGKFDEAERLFKQSLELAQGYKGKRNEARATSMLAQLRLYQGNAEEATRLAQQAIDFYEQGGFRSEASKAWFILGRAKEQKNDYAAAMTAYQRQLEVSTQVSDQDNMAFAHESIGVVFAKQEKYADARQHFSESSTLHKTLDNKINIGSSLTNLGNVLWQLGRYDDARGAFREAQAIVERPESGFKRLAGWFYLTNAQMALSEHHFDEAKERGAQALNAAGAAFKETVVEAKRTLCQAETFSARARQGQPLCEESLALAEQLGDQRVIARSKLALAETLFETGDTQGALSNALAAQETFARLDEQDSLWHALLVVAQASRRAGDESHAEQYARQSRDALSGLQSRYGADFENYLRRPDVQVSRKQLGELIAE